MRAYHRFKINSKLLDPPLLEPMTKMIDEIILKKAEQIVGTESKFKVSDVIIHDDPFYQKGDKYYIEGFASKVATFTITILPTND